MSEGTPPTGRLFILSPVPSGANALLEALGSPAHASWVTRVPDDLQAEDTVVLIEPRTNHAMGDVLLRVTSEERAALERRAERADDVLLACGYRVGAVLQRRAHLIHVSPFSMERSVEMIAAEFGAPRPLALRALPDAVMALARHVSPSPEERALALTLRPLPGAQVMPPGPMRLSEPTAALAAVLQPEMKDPVYSELPLGAFEQMSPAARETLLRSPEHFARLAKQLGGGLLLLERAPSREILQGLLARRAARLPDPTTDDAEAMDAWFGAAGLYGDDALLTWAEPAFLDWAATVDYRRFSLHMDAVNGVSMEHFVRIVGAVPGVTWLARRPHLGPVLLQRGCLLPHKLRQVREVAKHHWGQQGYPGTATMQAPSNRPHEAWRPGGNLGNAIMPFLSIRPAPMPPMGDPWADIARVLGVPMEDCRTGAELVGHLQRIEAEGRLAGYDFVSTPIRRLGSVVTMADVDAVGAWLQRPRSRGLRALASIAQGMSFWPVLTPAAVRGLFVVSQQAKSFSLPMRLGQQLPVSQLTPAVLAMLHAMRHGAAAAPVPDTAILARECLLPLTWREGLPEAFRPPHPVAPVSPASLGGSIR